MRRTGLIFDAYAEGLHVSLGSAFAGLWCSAINVSGRSVSFRAFGFWETSPRARLAVGVWINLQETRFPNLSCQPLSLSSSCGLRQSRGIFGR